MAPTKAPAGGRQRRPNLPRGEGSGAIVPRGPAGETASDVFLCDFSGAAPKDDMVSMEHPIFSLSTRPDRAILRYTHNGAAIEVVPSVKGRATIHDKDILIYCTSQLIAALNAGRPTARTLCLTAHDLMLATRRETSGDAYRRLREAFERLAGTRITTNIVTGPKGNEEEVTSGFGLIEAWEIVRKARGGRMVQVRVTLSDWLWRAVLAKSVLTLSRDYFTLRRPLERRLYELSRKHCGRQPEWRIGVATLHLKSGSASPLRVFRAMLRDIAAEANIPEYRLEVGAGDILTVTRRAAEAIVGPLAEDIPLPALSPLRATTFLPPLRAETLDAARALAPGQDIYALEAGWRGTWERSGRPQMRAPDKAFLGWVGKNRGA